MKTKNPLFAGPCLLTFGILGIAPVAQAAIINFTTGNFLEKGVGDEWGTPWDKITVTGVTSTVSGLDAINPQTATIGALTFQAGMNCIVCSPDPTGTISLDFTFGSSPQQLTAPFSTVLNANIPMDSLSVAQGAVIVFDLGAAPNST